MLVHAVDLAAVAWAQRLDGDGIVLENSAFDAPTEDEAIEAITLWWRQPHQSKLPDVLIIEDQPHGVRFDSIAKSVARMQGRIIDRMTLLGFKDKILFLPPSTWQHYFPGVWKGKAKGAAAAALTRGYEPPDMLTLHKDRYIDLHGKERQKIRTRLQKLQSDYVDAYLIACWAHERYQQTGSFEAPTTQRYIR